MERIVIQVKDRDKAAMLHHLLRMMDFIELVNEDETSDSEEVSLQTQKSKDFFALAGVWSGREVSLESIRQRAWPRQAQ